MKTLNAEDESFLDHLCSAYNLAPSATPEEMHISQAMDEACTRLGISSQEYYAAWFLKGTVTTGFVGSA